MSRRVVVTGLGAVTSLASKVDALWSGVLEGQSGIHEFQNIRIDDMKVRFGGEVTDWSTDGYIPPKEAKRVELFTQFAMVAAIDAVKDSGLDFEKEDAFRCGTVIGSGVGGINEIELQTSRLVLKGPDKVSPFTIPKLMLNAASGHVSIHYGLRGPNFATATACASATNAMGSAFKLIQRNAADLVITGGSEAACSRMAVAGFANMKALSDRHDDPTGASRPFDADRDGFVLAEGAGILVFEEYEHAKARGAQIYGEVLGYGASGDGGHITQPNPEGIGAGRAMSEALADASLDGDKIDYINAHGTSTPLGDKAETGAIKRVFGDHAYQLSVSSTKSQLGHMLGASGGVEAILSLKALSTGVIPPTINLETPDPECDLDYTPNTPKERDVNYALSNSFGFGGHNASLVMGRVE
ncbi:3-oxoacyl-[acyl-carrier-protein] synthase 2 [Planctomycetes bacterium MalM25]|nr:3-oxoacyl-[acyl-carrier-protein] synthase 2 [Planctomycetes bacterium MalM25]